MLNQKKLVIAITGASGAIYGIKALELLKKLQIETYLIISKAAHITIKQETSYELAAVAKLATHVCNVYDIGATIASGSHKTHGMIIAPCSMKTLGSLAASIEDNLITRAANVTLKERRPLILLCRETPLHAGYLENMLKMINRGAIIAPPVPAFYNLPKTIDDLITHTIVRTLDLMDIETDIIKRWQGIS